jgi:hypothetical protein
MLAHWFRAYGARDCRCRLFEQNRCDGRIDEQLFGMADSTSPDLFSGSENRRGYSPASRSTGLTRTPPPFGRASSTILVPVAVATVYLNGSEKAATPV